MAYKQDKNTCARTWRSKRGGAYYRENTVHIGCGMYMYAIEFQ